MGASDPKSILFVEEFAAALHAVGAELSADIGNCGGADSMGNTCEDYRASSIDRVFTMSTYPWRALAPQPAARDYMTRKAEAELAEVGAHNATGIGIRKTVAHTTTRLRPLEK